ncbi:hypothetical protein AB0F91_45625 [Amycolatopsis sp. NPDC023774]|uniref:hypothetical protein n=1 Tax=Amycolatopsis sp. NPDC023774 TaxID=3155015 RepID=UPI00340202FB
MANVIVSIGHWRRHRQLWLNSPALLARGIAQVGQGTVSLVADQVTPLDLKAPPRRRETSADCRV